MCRSSDRSRIGGDAGTRRVRSIGCTGQVGRRGFGDRRASLYQRSGTWLLQATGPVEGRGYRVATGPVLRLSSAVDAGELGRAIRAAQDHSRPLPGPAGPGAEPGALLEPLLRAAAVGSWTAFVRLARLVHIRTAGDMTTLSSHRRAGVVFVGLDRRPIEVATSCTDDELGRAALQALARST